MKNTMNYKNTNINRLLRQLTLGVFFVLATIISSLASAQTVTPGGMSFNHNTTGFILDGAHAKETCESCHTQGLFRGTPRDCATCHRIGGRAPGKPTLHIPTTTACDSCHGNVSWVPSSFRHQVIQGVVQGACNTCHNGGSATGRPPMHMPTTASCDSCHKTAAWTPAGFDHVNVIPGACVNCHNGSRASGKPSYHIATAAACDTCHNTLSWATKSYVHQLADSNCLGCHNGQTAIGKNTRHIPTTAQCSVCHKSQTTFSAAVMDHAGMSGNCSNCHNGHYINQNAQTKPATHVSTAKQCDACHASTSSWATVTYIHETSAVGTCSTCHNGTTAIGKPSTHIPTSAQCDTCHNGFAAFKPTAMNHTGMAGQCSTCHNGSYTYANALAKPTIHIPDNRQCDTCHTNGFSAWSPSNMNHSGLAGLCSKCHNGSFEAQNAQTNPPPPTHVSNPGQCDTCHKSTVSWATITFNHSMASSPVGGRCNDCHGTPPLNPNPKGLEKPARHIPTTAQCSVCHSGYVAFSPATMTHGLAEENNCSTCHSGAYNFANALSKPATHLQTAAQCNTCHKSYVAWKPASYAHDGTAPNNCSTCHGSTALGKSTSHIPTTAQCDTCHSGYIAFTAAIMNHAATHGPDAASNCATCHSGAYLGANAQAKSTKHVNTAAQCDTCHSSTTSWTTVTYVHENTAAGKCSACHNGATAIGKPTLHIPTSAQCDTCHNSFAAFKPASMNHTGLAGKCSTCHNGSYVYANALAKPATHIPDSRQCDTCHTNGFSTWSPSNMSHSGLAGQCASCHSGSFIAQNAQAKPSTHTSTVAQCDTCHKSTVSWATVTYVHASSDTGCASCHNGTKALGKPTNHIPTTVQCSVCHSGYVAFAPAIMVHGSAEANSCSTCHSGAYNFANALSKPATHLQTVAQCNTCHTSTVTWKPASFAHTGSAACSTCHNGTTALGKSTSHIPTSSECNSCHKNYVTFAPAIMDHSTGGVCSTCHNGSYLAQNAQTKPITHVPTANPCDTCHKSTTTWSGVLYTHLSSAVGTCSSCHNGTTTFAGVTPLGKPTNHIPTSKQCDSCHKGYASFNQQTVMDHAGTAGTCSSCHNSSYIFSGALSKATSHIPTTNQCDTCHTNTGGFTSWSVKPAMNHAGTTGQCSTCHNGSYIGVNALAKTATHIATILSCDSCHTTSAWTPTSFNHQGVVAGSCANCHNGISAAGKPAGSHIPTSQTCDTCHKTGVSWLPLKTPYSHTGVAAGSCASCHGGSYTNIDTKPIGTHIPTIQSCDICHRTTAWIPTSFSHQGVVAGSCATCHNGVAAVGKPAGTHIPTAETCDTCHKTGISWLPLKTPYSHTGVAAGTCSTCHGGSYTNIDVKPSVTHVPTSAACDACHTKTAWLPPIKYAHTGIAVGTCATCHSGTYANIMTKPSNHIPTTLPGMLGNECSKCHSSTSSFSIEKMNHGSMTTSCITCHDASASYLGNMIKSTRTTNHHGANAAGKDCSSSGCHRPLGNIGSTYIKWN